MIIQSTFITFSCDDEWILLGENRDSNPVEKKGGLWSGIAAPTSAKCTSHKVSPGACSPGKNFKICASKMPFPAF